MKRFGKVLVLTLSIIGLSLILGIATSRNVRAAVTALVTVANTSANPVPTQSVDAKNAFQTELSVTTPNVALPVAIPSGQRLVIDFISIVGGASSLSGPIQPEIAFQSHLTGGASATYYFDPGPTPVNFPNAIHLAQPVKVYADTLTVVFRALGSEVFPPNIYVMTVGISGHLVPIP
jgi:hypothetical protein